MILNTFIKVMKPDYIFEWSHVAVIQILENLLISRDPAMRKVMILAPPTWGKSELSSRLLPAFALGRMSSRVLKGSTNPYEIILASYGEALGKSFVNQTVSYCEKPEWRQIFQNVSVAPRGGGLGTHFARSDSSLDFVCDASRKKCLKMAPAATTASPPPFICWAATAQSQENTRT